MQGKYSRLLRTYACALTSGVAVMAAAGCSDAPAPTFGKRHASLSVTTTATKVVVTPNPGSAPVGDTVAFKATGYDASGTAVAVSCRWASDDTLVAAIDPNTGVARAKVTGSTLVKAGCDGVVGTATIGITTSSSGGTVAKVAVSPTSVMLSLGGTQQLLATVTDSAGHVLTGQTVTWTSSAAVVATVDTTGLVKAVGGGTATITASAGGKSGSASVAVMQPAVAGVGVSPSSTSLTMGGTVQLTATAVDSAGNVLTGQSFTWSSGAPSVATVSSSGLVTAVAGGAATITATDGGKSGTSAITVTAPAPSGTWPNNQPSGLTPLLKADGSTKYFFAPHSNVDIGAKWSDPTLYPAANNGSRVEVVSDPASKYGKAVQKWTFTGEQSGFNGFYAWEGSPGFGDVNGYKELYFRIVFEFDPNWQWELAHTQKLFYFATNRSNGGGINANSFYLSVDRNQIDFVDQANPGTGNGTPYDIDYRYNPPAGMIAAGKYITVELWIRANSSPTTPDGQARIWVDGTEITANMTALMGAYSGQTGLSNRIWCGDTSFFGTGSAFNGNFNNAQTLLYWGGTGDTAATNFYFNLSELYISGVPG